MTRTRLFALFIAAAAALLAAAGCAPPASPTTAPPATPTTAAAGPSATPRPTLTPTATPRPAAVPPLTREILKNAAYPMAVPGGDTAQLVDGVFRRRYLPDSATEMVVQLSYFVVHGDLNGDAAEDAVAVLIANPGGSGTFYYLAAVLNENGRPRPLAAQLLGDRVYIRSLKIEDATIVIELDAVGARDAACCPTDSKRLRYRLAVNALAQVDVTDLPDPKVSARLTDPPKRIEMAPGVTSLRLDAIITFNGIDSYRVAAQAGQLMTVTLASPHDDVWLSIRGSRDAVVLASILSETNRWAGMVPAAQDYMLSAVAAGGDTRYTLQIELTGAAPAPTPRPAATPTTGPAPSGGAIHLTFDDGPTAPQWTPQVLDVLARYDAKATFFILGLQAAKYPDLVAAEVKAGHTIANHTYEHHTLDKIGREAFIREVQNTEKVLGAQATKCLRPPYGATDAFTRAYATELGYSLVMWDIDTRDWSRPGAASIADEAVKNAFPGAVILFHDGGGDRAQTVEALGVILEGLRRQGYRFEPVCK